MDYGPPSTEPLTGEINTTIIEDLVIGSSDIRIASSNSEFHAEVPASRCTLERQLPEGTLGITDSVIGSLVVGSHGTRIDREGMKADIKISDTDNFSGICAPESDDDGTACWNTSAIREEQDFGSSIIVNSIVGSSKTDISMDGAVIKVKRKKGRGVKPSLQSGGTIVTNSATVNMVLYSTETNVNMKNADIDIK